MHLPDGAGLGVVDGLPMRLRGIRRAARCRLFQGEAAFGRCASKSMWHYGFKGHVPVAEDGLILAFEVAPANADERDMLLEMS